MKRLSVTPLTNAIVPALNSVLTNCIALLAFSKSFSDSFLNDSKSNFGSPSNAVLIPSVIPVKKSRIPSTNPVNNAVNFLTRLIRLVNASSILGNVVTNQPINTTPKKSNILPKNPFVLLVIRLPSFFTTPLTLEDSNSSSLFFLLIFSLLFLKYSLSFAVFLDLNKLVALV